MENIKRAKEDSDNIYLQCRKEKGYTRAEACELMDFVSQSRLEKVENEKSPVRPEEVAAMAKAYGKPELCNYYCTHECPIGQKYVPQLEINDLAHLALQLISSINSFEKTKDRLIEIAADGQISEEELPDFAKVEEGAEQLSVAVESLSLWISSMIESGMINKERFEAIKKTIK